MEGITRASWRLAQLRQAHPEADINRVGRKLIAWIPDESDKYSGTGKLADSEDELAAKLDG